jgi:pSer/pThr/pTyr-binding forkhead associated (FHA) protein
VPEGKPPFPESDVARRPLVITDRAVIGRRHSDGQPVEGVDVHLPDGPTDDAISHRHCVIESDATGWYVGDVDSRNGTYLNNRRVRGGAGTRTHRLRVGDKIRIGLWTCLTVVAVDQPAPDR